MTLTIPAAIKSSVIYNCLMGSSAFGFFVGNKYEMWKVNAQGSVGPMVDLVS